MGIQGGGHDRFGPVGGLQVYTEQVVDLARFLAGQYGLAALFDEGSPQVTVTAIRYAMALKAEMDLAVGLAREVSERAEATGSDYGQAFFNDTMAEKFTKVNRDLDKNHARTAQFRAELKELAEEAARGAPDGRAS